MFIDTHCHLGKDDYNDVKEVIKNMGQNIMIVSGADFKSNQEVLDLCNQYDMIYGTVGYHPSEVDTFNEDSIQQLELLLQHPKIVGVGEIGLDYHFGSENKEKQKKVFCTQIHLAQKYHKAIVIHSRDATMDTYQILKREKKEEDRVILHCYSSTYEMALEFLKLNIMFGIGGVLTFKNGQKLKEVVTKIDLSHLLLETDSPYLAPEPYRGSRNEPKYCFLIAQEIARLKEIPLEEVLNQTTLNAIRQFDLPIKL